MIIKPVLNRHYELGEGALWADERLYWFDIAAGCLYAWRPGEDEVCCWEFDQPVSSAAALEGGGLIVASDSALLRFDPETGASCHLVPLEADNRLTRSNDGRADRHGGFWISTMGKAGEAGMGGIWRYFQGQLRRLRTGLTIPNAICFSPDGGCAYFADTAVDTIWRWRLDAEGWPLGEPDEFVACSKIGGGPDGAVVDSAGYIWNARWGAGQLVRLAPCDGRIVETVRLSASQPSCPVFGGSDLGTIYVTSAREGMSREQLRTEPDAGAIFGFSAEVAGLPDVPVKLAS